MNGYPQRRLRREEVSVPLRGFNFNILFSVYQRKIFYSCADTLE